MTGSIDRYAELLRQVKARIAGAQTRAALAANRELLALYWEIGRLIAERQEVEGWGAAVIPRLARDLARELPGVRGFSQRNLMRMVRFAREYPGLGGLVAPAELPSAGGAPGQSLPASEVPRAVAEMQKAASGVIVPQPVAQLPVELAQVGEAMLALPWGHHVLLFERVKSLSTRGWYIGMSVSQGWNRDVLGLMLKSQAHLRQGAATTNFERCLPTIDAIEAELASEEDDQ